MPKFKDPNSKLPHIPRLSNRGTHKSLLKRNEKIVSMFKEGIPHNKIARMMKLNKSVISSVLKKHNLSSDENIKIRNERIVSVYKEEKDIKKTSEMLGIKKTIVLRILKKENIPVNSELKEKYIKIENYYLQGLKIKEIGKLVNLKSERVRQILAINGLRKLKTLVKGENKKELIKNIHIDLLAGLTHKELAKKYDYAINTIQVFIKNNKLPYPYLVTINKRNKLIIESIKSGRNVDRVADDFKLNRNFIYQICRNSGFHFKHIIRDRVKELSEKGLTPNQIASELKITSSAVTYHLRRFKKQKETE